MLGMFRPWLHRELAGADRGHHVGPAFGEIDRAGVDRHRRGDFHHPQLTALVEALGKGFGKRGRHVLGEQHRPGKLGR